MSQTWLIKDTAPDISTLHLAPENGDDEYIVYSASFESNGEVFSSLKFRYKRFSTTHTLRLYYNDTLVTNVLRYNIKGSYTGLPFVFENEAYRTLKFDTAPTGELLAWLQKNADAPIIDNLVTDRTQADVERVKALAAKGFAAMTADEQAEWLAGMKGAYNAADLNRVGTALNYLAGRLGAICGMSIAWSAKTDWAVTDIITASQAAEYRRQIQDIRDALTYPANAPDVPEIALLTYAGANDIERILTICETLVDNVINAFRYTGAAECAMGGLLT